MASSVCERLNLNDLKNMLWLNQYLGKAKRATIFAKACFGHPSPSKRQKSRGNQCLRRPDTPCVRVTASHHCKLDADSVTLPQMTSQRFGCNPRSPMTLRTTAAQNYLRLSRTTSPRFAFHGWQRTVLLAPEPSLRYLPTVSIGSVVIVPVA
jgi:hypothetical protein